MDDLTETDCLTGCVIGAAIDVHRELGPGLLESAYEACLAYELKTRCLEVEVQKPLPILYKNIKLDCGYRLDLVVENQVIIEIKSVENLAEVHHKQVLTYLKLTKIKLGILVNFNVADINSGIFRKVNKL